MSKILIDILIKKPTMYSVTNKYKKQSWSNMKSAIQRDLALLKLDPWRSKWRMHLEKLIILISERSLVNMIHGWKIFVSQHSTH